MPLSQDWWPKEDPETAASIPAWPQARQPYHDSKNTDKPNANRGYSCDMLPASGCGIQDLPYKVGSWKERVGRRGRQHSRSGGCRPFLWSRQSRILLPLLAPQEHRLHLFGQVQVSCVVGRRSPHKSSITALFQEEIGVKGMGSPRPSIRAGSLSNKVEVQLFMRAKLLTDVWPPELWGRRWKVPA